MTVSNFFNYPTTNHFRFGNKFVYLYIICFLHIAFQIFYLLKVKIRIVHLNIIYLKRHKEAHWLIFIFQAGIPYNSSNSCQQANRCNTNNANVQLPTSNNVQGVNVLPIPITVPVPIVSTELFSHSLQVNSSSGSTHGNVGAIIQTQQQQQQQQQGPPQQEGSNSDLVPFQICPQQAEMMYSNMETSSNQQQRSSQN